MAKEIIIAGVDVSGCNAFNAIQVRKQAEIKYWHKELLDIIAEAEGKE